MDRTRTDSRVFTYQPSKKKKKKIKEEEEERTCMVGRRSHQCIKHSLPNPQLTKIRKWKEEKIVVRLWLFFIFEFNGNPKIRLTLKFVKQVKYYLCFTLVSVVGSLLPPRSIHRSSTHQSYTYALCYVYDCWKGFTSRRIICKILNIFVNITPSSTLSSLLIARGRSDHDPMHVNLSIQDDVN